MVDKIVDLLETARDMSASDLHLNVDRPPIVRVDGKLKKLPDCGDLGEKDLRGILEAIASQEQMRRFHECRELDFSYEDERVGRCRVNACIQQGVVSLAFRILMRVLSPLESLGLPEIYAQLSLSPRGLILITGPTGSGKSTSMAAMINHINTHQERHIVTIEDPIEYVYRDDKSVIIQRNVGQDTDSFADALKHALRHDPDVIVVGEMRDLATIATAISAAETGHLVLGTLHTLDAAETIDRIIDVFPAAQQPQVIAQLSNSLRGILAQRLVPSADKSRRILACEVLRANMAARHVIRDQAFHQLVSIMQMGKREGMITLDTCLAELYEAGEITYDTALTNCSEPELFRKKYEQPKSATRIME